MATGTQTPSRTKPNRGRRTASRESVPDLLPGPQPSLEPPETTRPWKIAWRYAISITIIHVLACLAFLPWFFSWTGVVAFAVGLYFFGTLGINLCYHRLLTHQGFTCPKWLEHTLAVLGICCLQDTPARWVATHRLHHRHSDQQPDPHSPLVTFVWGHFEWLFVENRDFNKLGAYERYARDLLRDPFYLRVERNLLWVGIYAAHAAIFFLAGFGFAWATTGSAAAGAQFGVSLLVWGALLRTVVGWHIAWSVNSITHMWGYRNYPTSDNSRNNWLVGLLSNGEGWHNNHHADQRSAAHGHKWWELDITYLTIRALAALGLAKDVVRPRGKLVDKS